MQRLLIVSIICTAALTSDRLAATPLLELDAPLTPVTTGAPFDVQLWITGGVNVIGYAFDLTVDAGRADVLRVTEGVYLSSVGATYFLPGTMDGHGGRVHGIGNALFSGSASGDGVLVAFTLKALAPGMLTIGVVNPLLVDTGFVTTMPAPASVEVRVNGIDGPAVPEPAFGALVGSMLLMGTVLHRRSRGLRRFAVRETLPARLCS